jgi:acetylornithine deacetylase/succinyl-diaminopimelate desuccinylase-like protein
VTAAPEAPGLRFDPHDDDYVRELSEFVAIPTVSRDADAATMLAGAQWLASRLSVAAGRVEPTAGHPVVRGEWLGASGAPTVLVYGHYDVQPTGDAAEWRTPPFRPTAERDAAAGDILRGRGVSDDKGTVYLVAKTAQAFLAQEGRLPLNVKFLFEGEEEVGSPHLAAYLTANASDLAADLVISADGAMWRPGEPSLSLQSRGMATVTITVHGASGDLHSGRYGGSVANPVHALTQILASLHDADGRVAVAGFYDGIPELSAERRSEIASIPFDEAAALSEIGLDRGHGEPGYTTLERLWERPTLEINGVSGGGKYTVIPHVATGWVSCRLVPGQSPEAITRAIADHVSRQDARGVVVDVRADAPGVPAYTIPAGHPAIRAAADALGAVYPDQSVVLACIGGTVPATSLFEQVLGAKTLFFSFSTADENLHAPNEFLRVRRLREGMRAWEALWRLLAEEPLAAEGSLDA